MNIQTGFRLFLARARQTQFDFQAFLNVCRHHYSGRKIAMFVDGDSSHTAIASLTLAERLSFEPLWLPVRAPKLNPMDELWGQAKDEICSNWPFESIHKQEISFLNYLYNISNRQALQTAGVLSGNFWLTR